MHYGSLPSTDALFGPLVNTWTMRYEAKLSVIKRASCHVILFNYCKAASASSMLPVKC